METVATISPSRYVHEIYVYSKNSIKFTIDLYKNNDKSFDLDVTIFKLNNSAGELFTLEVNSKSTIDLFRKSIIFIKNYFEKNNDNFLKITNPCNTPYITEEQQKEILNQLDINIKVEVNP